MHWRTFKIWIAVTAWKLSKYGFFSGLYFPTLYSNWIRTRKNSESGHFSRSEFKCVWISEWKLQCFNKVTAQKMKFSIKDFFRKLRTWSHLLEKFLMENFIFCAAISFKGAHVVDIKLTFTDWFFIIW